MEVVLQGDGEPALKQLVQLAAAKLRNAGLNIDVRWSPRGSSQSNGGAEEAGQEMLGLARTLMLNINETFDIKLLASDPAYSGL